MRREHELTLALVLLAYGAIGCHHHETEEAHGHEHGDTRGVTHWTAHSELFVEFEPLVKGQASTFLVHLTRLRDFAPVSEGTVSLVLSSAGVPEARVDVSKPHAPGIYDLALEPSSAGKRELSIVHSFNGERDVHELGEVLIRATLAEAGGHEQEVEDDGAISLLKEQQWMIDFATEEVGKRILNASIRGFGKIRPRPDGELVVTAPVSGRLHVPDVDHLRAGTHVSRGETLAWISPRSSSAADPVSFDLAVAKGELALERARRESSRLEKLWNQGTVAEKRFLDAKAAEKRAVVELEAAKGRLAQQQSIQGSRGAGGLAIRAGIAGVIADAHVGAAGFVEVGQPLFHIIDLEELWLEVGIPAVYVERLSNPHGVWFEVEGVQQPFEVGADRLVAQNGALDPLTRTLPISFAIANPNRRLRPGFLATAHVMVGEPVSSLAIPLGAVVDDDGSDVAYVQVSGEAFERRVLQLGIRDKNHVQVLAGLQAGERVVTRNALAVKLASMSTSATRGHGHPH